MTQKWLAVFWGGEIVDFVTLQEAERILQRQPDIKLVEQNGKKSLVVTTPRSQWRTIPV